MTEPPFAALWDVDGTLVDTAELHFDAWCRFAADLALPFSRADFAATFGKRNPEIIRQLFDPTASDDQCLDWGERKEVYYRKAAAEKGIQLLPGVAALLAALADARWLQAVGSSAPRANLTLLFELTDTTQYFSAIISGDDVSRGKPDPEVFLTAASRLGVPPTRCVVLEDAVAGVQAATAAGMVSVGVTFAGHHSRDSLRAAGAGVVVETLTDLSVTRLASLIVDRM
jgi:beta-phosphoglucomutase